MGAFLFFAFIVLTNLDKKDHRFSDLAKVIIGINIVMVALSVLFRGLLGSPLAILGLVGMVSYSYYRGKAKKEAMEREKSYQWQNGEPRTDSKASYQEAMKGYKDAGSMGLPKSIKGRLKVVSAFNKKYGLCLTDEQMDSIVNSSYRSNIWKHELASMNQKYETVYQWITGPTSWLRAYMYAFHVQEIIGDFEQQERIALHSFDQIFNYSDTLGHSSISDRIKMVNDRFMCSFDDITFMEAYRFLEKHGISHTISVSNTVENTDEVDELLKKYSSAEAETGE